MESKISYYEYRERGGTQIDVNIDARTPSELDMILLELRGAKVAPPPGTPNGPPDAPVEPPATTREPYFDLGDGEGKAGDVITIPMLGGCRHAVTGFHIGGGLAGYGKFEAQGAKLGAFVQSYLNAKQMGDAYWSGFNMAKHDPHKALPEEWWDYAMAFFSISQERGPIEPIQIPVDTELFTVQIKILEGTAPGVYDLSCEDERYWTHSRPRRRDFLYTTNRDSEFARGGVTRVETSGGKLTVLA